VNGPNKRPPRGSPESTFGPVRTAPDTVRVVGPPPPERPAVGSPLVRGPLSRQTPQRLKPGGLKANRTGYWEPMNLGGLVSRCPPPPPSRPYRVRRVTPNRRPETPVLVSRPVPRPIFPRVLSCRPVRWREGRGPPPLALSRGSPKLPPCRLDGPPPGWPLGEHPRGLAPRGVPLPWYSPLRPWAGGRAPVRSCPGKNPPMGPVAGPGPGVPPRPCPPMGCGAPPGGGGPFDTPCRTPAPPVCLPRRPKPAPSEPSPPPQSPRVFPSGPPPARK